MVNLPKGQPKRKMTVVGVYGKLTFGKLTLKKLTISPSIAYLEYALVKHISLL